jgi:ligand-binding sensor protein/AraC-like DNA-binding protein
MRNTLNVRCIFENPRFQKIQDAMAIATGLAFITVDYKGCPITSHSSCSEFCTIMRSSSTQRELCERCDSRGGLEAARTQSPYIYLCHAGLVDFAVPIIHEGNYLGAVLGGQVLLSNQEENAKLEQIYYNKDMQIVLHKNNTLIASRSIPVMDLNKIKILSEMLFVLCKILIDEARLKFSINELKENDSYIHVDEIFFDKYSQIISDTYYDISAEDKNPHSILKPAFDYINDNLDGDLSLKKVSSICKISPSYFSRIFAQEKLGSYCDYINRLRINHAKRYLKSTDLNISQISNNLGFNDCGYFIKVFKKFESITPLEYRNINNSFHEG